MATTSTGPKTPVVVEHPNLTAALVAFQKQIPPIRKGNTASTGSYTYQYADLTDILEVAKDPMSENGLTFTARTTVADGQFLLVYELRHVSDLPGDRITGEWPLPMNVPPQRLGSELTYARRYTFCAVTGIAPGGDDDDSAAAQSAPVVKRAKAPANFPQLVADATTVEELLAIHSHAQEEGWLDSDTIAALGARKQAILADIADIKAKLSGD